ncbi:hypothetical protein DFS33DRAFT_862525 [Desarmillaria ectypa]|nr:hypothetical protein DFS33DRAFT_862525 [Desarmillaria ectypa]
MSCLTCRNCGFVNLVPLEPWQLQNITIIHNSDSFVSQILHGSRPFPDSDHTLINAEIVKLDRLRSLYDARLQEIQLRWHTVSKAPEKRKSIFTPICRLPRDILIEIFHSICDSWWQNAMETHSRHLPQSHSLDISGPLWVLGRVCGLWRDTLHTSPALWAQNVVVTSPLSERTPEILQTYLERTGEHPLSIRAVFSKWCGLMGWRKIMALLVQSCNRWKNVRICTVVHHTHCLESIVNFPTLETIELDIVDDYRSNYHLDICSKAPQLWIIQYSGCITCAEDLRLLFHLSNLRTCHLRPYWKSIVQIEVLVVLAELRHLYVDCAKFPNFLTAPLLQSLTVSESASQGLACVISFFRQSGCYLKSLSYSMRWRSVLSR